MFFLEDFSQGLENIWGSICVPLWTLDKLEKFDIRHCKRFYTITWGSRTCYQCESNLTSLYKQELRTPSEFAVGSLS